MMTDRTKSASHTSAHAQRGSLSLFIALYLPCLKDTHTHTLTSQGAVHHCGNSSRPRRLTFHLFSEVRSQWSAWQWSMLLKRKTCRHLVSNKGLSVFLYSDANMKRSQISLLWSTMTKKTFWLWHNCPPSKSCIYHVVYLCVFGVHIEVPSLPLGLPCQSFCCSMSAMFSSLFISCFYIYVMCTFSLVICVWICKTEKDISVCVSLCVLPVFTTDCWSACACSSMDGH